MRRDLSLLALFLFALSGCSVLRGGADQCKNDKCEGGNLYRCTTVKESYARFTFEECTAGTTCVIGEQGYGECAQR